MTHRIIPLILATLRQALPVESHAAARAAFHRQKPGCARARIRVAVSHAARLSLC